MLSGWSGQILRVDLSKREATAISTVPYKPFIGGRGINTKILFDEVGPEVGPFDPANMLVFGPGVLTGTPAPTASRMTITTLCPNGIIGSSGIGGYIGAEIKHAGYDNIVVQGKSDKPVYLYIHDGTVEFRDAGEVWGRETMETEEIIRKETGDPDVQVACVGSAGENMVSFACIKTMIHNVAGRGGTGAIMGSKNLKAIAVRGKHGVEISRLQEFLELARQERERLSEYSAKKGPLGRPASDINQTAMRSGVLAFGNWEDVDWDEIDAKNYVYGGKEYYDKYYHNRVGCFSCPVARWQVCSSPETDYGVAKCGSLPSFTLRVWNHDYEVMANASHLCNNYGLDILSTANIIGFLMELYNRGIITEKDTDGIPMKRGDKDAIITTIHKLAHQEGFGKLFRDGVLAGARMIGRGAEECAMHVKGLEMSLREFRARKATALCQAVATKMGGGEFPLPEATWSVGTTSKRAVDPTTYNGKALMVWDQANLYKVPDMLGICKGPWSINQSLDIPARLFSLATGIDTGVEGLLFIAQRVQVLERAFDVTRGIRRKDDTLPQRMFETVVPGGPLKGERLDKDRFDEMVSEYYEISGWDEDGVPRKETFEKYGLVSEWQTFEKRLGNKERPAKLPA
ncbi:MAG: aldehyde ferredoxin oxidoreductase family protein [Dehalococcoidales bacterium]|jgi:aldehyde:ferredoxin oxidoreductase